MVYTLLLYSLDPYGRTDRLNSFTQICWNSSRTVPSLPLTVPYITLQRSCPVVTGSWMKSPIKRTDMPSNVWSGLYTDQSFVSNRTRNCVLNKSSSITTIFNWFPPSDLNISSIAVPALKLGAGEMDMADEKRQEVGVLPIWLCPRSGDRPWEVLQRLSVHPSSSRLGSLCNHHQHSCGERNEDGGVPETDG